MDLGFQLRNVGRLARVRAQVADISQGGFGKHLSQSSTVALVVHLVSAGKDNGRWDAEQAEGEEQPHVGLERQ